MDGDRENFAEFAVPNKESSSSPPSQTDIPVVSLHQSLLRQHHLSLNQPKEQNTSQRRDNNSQHHNHHHHLPVQEERDHQMLLNDSQLPVPLQTPKLGDSVKGEPQICLPLTARFNQAPQSKPTSWTCSLCPLKYKRPADLNRHMKRKHGMSLMKNDKNVLVPIVISQQHKTDYHDLQPLNLSLKCAFSDASFESAESMESEMTIDDDQPLDLSSNKNNPIDYRQKTLNKNFDHSADGKVYTSSKINMTEKSFNTFNIAIPNNQTSNAFHSGRTSISAPAIRYRPFKCSECGRRSNWRWDLNKHIRTSNHPHAHLIELSEHVARATFHEVLKKDNSYCDTILPDIQNLQPDSNSTAVEASSPSIPAQYKQYLCNACGYRSGWKCDMVKHVKLLHNSTSITLLTEIIAKETLPNYEKHHQENKDGSDWTVESNQNKSQQLCVNPLESSDYLVVSCNSMDGSFPFSSSHTVDARKTKKFKCSACPYRSNFRSDVGRHIRHKHDRATCRIVVMSEAEAASTLGEYMDTWARKKFVPSPNKRRCLMPLSCLHATEVYCGQSHASPFAISPTSSMTEHIKPPTLAFTQESSLENHMKKSKRWWKCSSCDYRDQSKDVIVQHWHYKHNNVSLSSEESPFLFDVVGPVAEFSSFPETHRYGRKEETVQISPELKEAFDNESNENSNERTTESEVPEDKKLSCDVCPYKTSAQELLDVHKSYHKVSEGSTFSCTFCQYFVPTSPLLNQHLLLHTEENKSSRTPQCTSPNESNQNSEDLKSQVDDTSTPVNLSNISALLPCSDSEKSHDKVSMFLMTNAIRAGGRTTYLCSQCPYVSCNRNDYLYHRQFHRPRPTAFKCPHCPYWVSQKRLLSQHYKVHELDYQQKHRGQDYTDVLIKQRVEYFSSGDKNNNSLDISTNNSPKTFDTPIQVIQQTESLNCPADNEDTLAASKVKEVVERADDNSCSSSAENTFGISEEKGVFLKSLGLTASLA